MSIEVFVTEKRNDTTLEVDAAHLSELARSVLEKEGTTQGEFGLVFVDENEMSELNSAHMGKDGPTDVLAFPIDATQNPAATNVSQVDVTDENPLIGDVVVCPAYAAKGIADGTANMDNLKDELALLVVHGTLHVLGYDHQSPEEAAVMQARERELLAQK